MSLRRSSRGAVGRVAPVAAALVVTAAAAAGCGVRASPGLIRAAANAELGRSAGPGGAGAAAGAAAAVPGSGGGQVSGARTGGAPATGSSSAGGAPVVGGTGGAEGAAGSGAVVGSGAAVGDNGGATDTGVTATAITVANVSDLSGPVPGLFQDGVTGTEAYFNYVNSQGGLYGRQIRLDTADSETDCAATQNAYQSLIPKVFGFIGSWEVYDQCAAQALGSRTIPALQYALSPQAAAWPDWYSIDPIKPGTFPDGPFGYFAHRLGPVVQATGSIYGDLSSVALQEQGIESAAERAGFRYVYKDAFPATQSNYTTDVVRMEAANVKVVLEYDLSTQQAATLVQEINQQNWHPAIVCTVCYAGAFEQLVGGGSSAVQGIMGSQFEQMYLGRPAPTPEVALYQEWMARTNPNQGLDLESFYSWAEAALFVQALKSEGPRVTRAGLVNVLHGIKSFSDNGAFGPSDIADKIPTSCYVLWRINDGAYQEFDTPANGFDCNGSP